MSVKGPFIVVFVFVAPIDISVKFVSAGLFPIFIVGAVVPDVIVLFPVPILIFPSAVPFVFVLGPIPKFNTPVDCVEQIPKFAVVASPLTDGAERADDADIDPEEATISPVVDVIPVAAVIVDPDDTVVDADIEPAVELIFPDVVNSGIALDGTV